MSLLILAAFWADDDCAKAIAAATKPYKIKGTGGAVVTFHPAHPQTRELLADLRRFDLDEVADSRPFDA